jgi:hypothetical protein
MDGTNEAPKKQRAPMRVRSSHDWASELSAAVVLSITVLVIYLPAGHYPFFSVDDFFYIVNNQHVQVGPSWNTLTWAFKDVASGEWHPVTWLSHGVDCQLFGLNAGWHHRMNVFLHAANAVLLFWVLLRATGCNGRSFTVAALFAVHPMNVEPVVWLAERKTLLSTLFFLLALDAYRRYVQRPGEVRYWIVMLLFLLGLMSKPQVIMLPFVLVFWDYWPLNRMPAAEQSAMASTSPAATIRTIWSSVRDKIPIFMVGATYALFAMMLRRASGYASPAHYALSIRLANAIISYMQYLEKAFWPVGLAPSYVYPGMSFLVWKLWAASACLLLTSALVATKLQYRYLLVGWCWFVVTLLPMIGIIQGPMFMADRYAYISFIGLYIVISWGLADLAHNATMVRCAAGRLSNGDAHWLRSIMPRLLSNSMIAGVGIVLIALSCGAHRQVMYWSDELILWSHAAQISRNNWFVEHELGRALTLAGKQGDALQHFNKVLLLNPQDPYVNIEFGFWEHQHGNLYAAIPYYKVALAMAGENEKDIKIRAATNLGLVYRALGDSRSADQYFARAAEEGRD